MCNSLGRIREGDGQVTSFFDLYRKLSFYLLEMRSQSFSFEGTQAWTSESWVSVRNCTGDFLTWKNVKY